MTYPEGNWTTGDPIPYLNELALFRPQRTCKRKRRREKQDGVLISRNPQDHSANLHSLSESIRFRQRRHRGFSRGNSGRSAGRSDSSKREIFFFSNPPGYRRNSALPRKGKGKREKGFTTPRRQSKGVRKTASVSSVPGDGQKPRISHSPPSQLMDEHLKRPFPERKGKRRNIRMKGHRMGKGRERKRRTRDRSIKGGVGGGPCGKRQATCH